MVFSKKHQNNFSGAELDEFERRRNEAKAEKAAQKKKDEMEDSSDEEDDVQDNHDIMIKHESNNKVRLLFSNVSRFLVRILIQHIEMKNSLDS